MRQIPHGYEYTIVPGTVNDILRFNGHNLDIIETNRNGNVGTIEDSSKIRGEFTPKRELKTRLIMTNSAGLALVHIPGNKSVDFKLIRKALKREFGGLTHDAERATINEMRALHCEHGTMNPFNEFLAGLPQFVSEDIVENFFVATNAGTHKTFVKFDPELLLTMDKNQKIVRHVGEGFSMPIKYTYPHVIRGDFSKEK